MAKRAANAAPAKRSAPKPIESKHFESAISIIAKHKDIKDSDLNDSITGQATTTVADATTQQMIDITKVADELTKKNNKKTIMVHDVVQAIRLNYHGEELAGELVKEAAKAAKKYAESEKGGSQKVRAGLVFMPTRVKRLMRANSNKRIGAAAAVAVAAAGETFARTLLKKAQDKKGQKTKRVNNRHLGLAAASCFGPSLPMSAIAHSGVTESKFVGKGSKAVAHKRSASEMECDDDDSGKKQSGSNKRRKVAPQKAKKGGKRTYRKRK